MAAVGRLVSLHSDLLEAVSHGIAHPVEGLSQAATIAFRRKLITPSQKKKLVQFDNCTAWLRHASTQKCNGFREEILHQLARQAELIDDSSNRSSDDDSSCASYAFHLSSTFLHPQSTRRLIIRGAEVLPAVR